MSSIQEELKQAYQLLRGGDQAGALALLTPICRAHPDHADAWWLLANALDDPRKKREALQKVLAINPFHEQADRMLEKINEKLTSREIVGGLIQHIKNSSAAAPMPARAPQRSSSSAAVLLVLLGILLLGGIAALAMMQQSDGGTDPTADALGFAASPTSGTPRPSNTPLPRATLPPQWTAAPTTVNTRIGPTQTSWIQTRVPVSTADPALFGETYWEGTGNGITMDRYTRSDGRHLRFFEFPIRIYVRGADTLEWEEAVAHALSQINPYVPIELTLNEPEAHILVDILPSEQFELLTICEAKELDGCAGLYDLGDIAGGDRYHRIHGDMYLRKSTLNPKGVFLHELLHALGISVHSSQQADIMHSAVEEEQIYMSQRDINTLLRLYANPSYAD